MDQLPLIALCGLITAIVIPGTLWLANRWCIFCFHWHDNGTSCRHLTGPE